MYQFPSFHSLTPSEKDEVVRPCYVAASFLLISGIVLTTFSAMGMFFGHNWAITGVIATFTIIAPILLAVGTNLHRNGRSTRDIVKIISALAVTLFVGIGGSLINHYAGGANPTNSFILGAVGVLSLACAAWWIKEDKGTDKGRHLPLLITFIATALVGLTLGYFGKPALHLSTQNLIALGCVDAAILAFALSHAHEKEKHRALLNKK